MENTTADQWQFLTTEQALEDIVYFANSFALSKSTDIHPSKTPWIMLGGSYPGVRASFMRIRNPEVIYASWASSAPVHAQVDMASYYKAAERSLTRNCSADWVAVTKYVDDTLNGDNETAIVDLKFNLLKAHLSGPGETRNNTAQPFEFGVVAQFGIDTGFQAFLTAISEIDYAAIPGNADDPVQDLSWMWQYCSEYGFYQRGDPNNPLSIETSFLSLELFQQQCNETFPKGLPPSPRLTLRQLTRGEQWALPQSNRTLHNVYHRRRFQGATRRRQTSPHFWYHIRRHGACLRHARFAHPDANHTDFKTVGFYSPVSQQPFYAGLGLFSLALDEWLPCFVPR